MKIHLPDLEGKKILVTGANRGIGKSICLELARQKAHIIYHCRSEEKGAELRQELEKLGAQHTGLYFDIDNADQINDVIKNFDQGPIEGLVNNAGMAKDQLLLRLRPQDIDQILKTNLNGALYLTQALAKNFLRAKNASIVNVSSVVGLMGNASQVAYAASKAGLIGLTKSVAKELGSRNVRCNAICPGFIVTDMTDGISAEAKEKYHQNIPLGRFGESEEIANLVCFLLSQASSYITGEVIKIDGGLYT